MSSRKPFKHENSDIAARKTHLCVEDRSWLAFNSLERELGCVRNRSHKWLSGEVACHLAAKFLMQGFSTSICLAQSCSAAGHELKLPACL